LPDAYPNVGRNPLILCIGTNNNYFVISSEFPLPYLCGSVTGCAGSQNYYPCHGSVFLYWQLDYK
jgi:hypothetical protein